MLICGKDSPILRIRQNLTQFLNSSVQFARKVKIPLSFFSKLRYNITVVCALYYVTEKEFPICIMIPSS